MLAHGVLTKVAVVEPKGCVTFELICSAGKQAAQMRDC